MNITAGTEVIWIRPRRAFVRGIACCFVNVHQAEGPVMSAVLLVTQDAGLYRAGDIVPAALAELVPSGGGS